MKKFEVGKKYQMRFITDADLKSEFECIKRTEKSVTMVGKHETFTKKIRQGNEGEFVICGNYSMAPFIRS